MTTISTPPPTELTTPSPSEINTHDTQATMSARPIYLIVATALTPALGIGNKGNLPWTQIRCDMAFFRKVTSSSPQSSSGRNAVIMGRKTWDSIPERFRPLSGRLNIILTRADEAGCSHLADTIRSELQTKTQSPSTIQNDTKQVMVHVISNQQSEVIVTNSLHSAISIDQDVTGLFCIGGAEIYNFVLKDQQLRPRCRVLQTLVRKVDGGEFVCDTFWPETMNAEHGWKQATSKEVRGWIGGDLPQGENEWCEDEKAGVEIQVVGWERT